MPLALIVLGLVGAVFMGAVGGYYAQTRLSQSRVATAERSAAKILSEADRRQKELLLEAKEEAIRVRQQAESELRDRRKEIQRSEQRLNQKEENLDRKLESLEQRQRNLQNRERDLEEARSSLATLEDERREELERLSNLTVGEAREMLLAQIEREIRDEANRRLREIEQEVKEEADQRARKIIAVTMQRLTSEVVSEGTVSVVPLPSEDMKGRIIGREGRNIRSLEHLTGVDVIIDDTPDAVTLSAFDPVRREVAKIALTKLLTDGRIHPARIEEMVEKARKEVEASIKEAGESAATEAGAPGLHPEIIRTLGRLKYRYSYGQNQLRHAVETANLAAMIAHELGGNVDIARRGGLLHDLGKAIDHEVEGTHAILGAELARRYSVHAGVIHCIEAHHEEVEPTSVEALITIVADAISGSRPGARRESLDQYVKRLEALEAVANGFPGVDKSFAIQAGREIRIIVKPEEVDDLGASRMAKEISRRIQESLDYPGQVKVTVIRERRSVEYAK
ncbi:MAG: ribonuclease Y [Chloroflexi bacterium]|jgi:ribonuclease Y|nr:MAG: ribonuclease Y [Chloroflexota bacterium]